MLDDDVLGNLRGDGEPREVIHNLQTAFRTDDTEMWAHSLSFKWVEDPDETGLAWDSPVSLAIGRPGESQTAAYHVTYSPVLGWTVDIHDSLESAVLARDTHATAGGGGLLLHGCYSTDGTSAFRLGDSLSVVGFVRAQDVQHASGVRDWLSESEVLDETAIVGLLLPELYPEALVSYAAVAGVTGLKLQTLRTYVHRSEGSDIPFRQFSTEQGHPQWSRPVIARWAGLKVNPRYSVDACLVSGVIRAANHGLPYPNDEVAAGITRAEAKALVKRHLRAAKAAGFEVAETDFGYLIRDECLDADQVDLAAHDFEDVYYSMSVFGPEPGPILWP